PKARTDKVPAQPKPTGRRIPPICTTAVWPVRRTTFILSWHLLLPGRHGRWPSGTFCSRRGTSGSFAPDGNQTLISRGVYRLSSQDISSGRVTFQLHGNGWHFDAGHIAKLELLGKDEPYLQPNKEPFQIAVSGLVVELPTLEPPTSTEPFSTPPPNTTPPPGGGGGGSVIVPPAIGQGKPLPKAARRLHLIVTPTRVRALRRTRLRFVVTTRFNHRIYRVGRVTVRIAGRKVSTDARGRASIVLRFRSSGRRAVRADARTFAGDRRHIVVVRPRRSR
ncbi:MAG: hypothetical protein ACR2NB_04965, partial [Solirubrobacteraceae bacterium]